MRTRIAVLGIAALVAGLAAPITPTAADPGQPQPAYAQFQGGPPAFAAAVDRQADGKLVAAGYATISGQKVFALARWNTDGTPDTSFGTNGTGTVTTQVGLATMDSVASDVRILPNGTIVAGGYAYWYKDAPYPVKGKGNNPVFALVGYTPTGVPDPNFGASFSAGKPPNTIEPQDGVALVAVLRNDRVTALALNGTGIVATGPVRAQDPPGKMFGLAAFTEDGSLDTSFGDQGTITTRFAGTVQNNIPLDVFVGGNGEIVAMGSDSDTGQKTANFAVAKWTREGAIQQETKTLVSVDGKFDAGYGGELLSDGRIVMAGLSGDVDAQTVSMVMTRLNPGLTVDTGFGTGGYTITNVPGWAQAVLQSVEVQRDNGLLGAGFVSNGTTGPVEWALSRYRENGTTDPAFGTNGVLTTPVGVAIGLGTGNAGFNGAVDVLVEEDGSNVVVGTAIETVGANPTFAIVRVPTTSVAYEGAISGVTGSWPMQASVTAPDGCQDGKATFEVAGTVAEVPVTKGVGSTHVSVPVGEHQVTVTYEPSGQGCLGSSYVRSLSSSAPTPGPTPPAPVPPVPEKTQKPVHSLNLPATLWRSGRTMLLTVPVRTNAGQKATVTVKSGTRSRAMGETRADVRVFTRGHRMYVWLSGRVPSTVRVRVHAPAVPGYAGYTKTKTYRTKAAS